MEFLVAFIIVGVLFAITVGVFIVLLVVMQRRVSEADLRAMEEAERWLEKQTDVIRADAIAKSKAVVRGKVAEHLVPFDNVFEFDPRDCRYLGAPIDFVCFDGMTEGLLERIVFVEVKTGRSRLSAREREIRDAIFNGEVAFLTYQVDDEGKGQWSV